MKTSYQYFNAHANGAMHMQMMQCMHDFTSTHTSQREGVRAATTLLINVHCCTGTYAPIRLWFLQMHINGKSANAHIAIYALHNSTIVHKI